MAKRKAKQRQRQYVITCSVKLEGATMFVVADTEAEALAKAAANEWEDIDYARGAALTDWEVTGKPKLNE